jgi:hypothetical protein
MDPRSNRIIIPFDDFYDQFSPDMPPRLKSVMDTAEFESCIQAINKTITYKLLASRRAQKTRLGILIVLGICIVGEPLIVLLLGSRSVPAYLIPPTICFFLFLGLAIYSYKMSMSVSQLAARSIEGVLRDFNKKHAQHNITWRLHKKSTINEDYGFDDDMPTQGQAYSYWIEVEISESNFNLLHEAATPEKLRPLRPPAPPKSPLSISHNPANETELKEKHPQATLSSDSSRPSHPLPDQPLLNLDEHDDNDESSSATDNLL